MRSLIRNKRGDIFQMFPLLILLTAVAIIGLLMLVMSMQVNTFWRDSGMIEPNSSMEYANNVLMDTGPKTTDYAVFFLFLGMNIGIVISAVRTKFSPTLIFMMILLTFLAIMIAAGMVNIYQGMAHAQGVTDTASGLNLTNFLFSKYTPLMICMISALIVIIMMGKSGGDIVT